MSEIKNVLSIDIDYFMSPCIQLYNGCVPNIMHKIGDKFGQQETGHYGMHLEDFWKYMNEELFCEKFYSYDEIKFEKVQKLLLDKAKNIFNYNIYFGKEHDSILTFLCGDKAKKDCVYNVYNIDHHHDLYYHIKAREEIERFSFANLSDWVWYLYEFNKLNNYYWISNEESQKPFFDIKDYKVLDTIYDIKDVSELENIDFDYIFVCKSEYYVPLKYHFLFDTLRLDVGKLKNTVFTVDNNSYCSDKTRFPVGW